MSLSHASFKTSEQVAAIYSAGSMTTFGRPPTNIGKQGAHVSAYVLIETLATSALSEYGLQATVMRFFSFFSDLLSDILRKKEEEQELLIKKYIKNTEKKNAKYANAIFASLAKRATELDDIIDNSRMQLEALINEDKQEKINKERILAMLSTEPDLCKDVSEKWKLFSEVRYKTAIEQLARVYLTIRNKMPNTAFPQQGSAEQLANEGAIIKSASTKLRELENKFKVRDGELTKKEINSTAKEVAQLMLNLLWFPKIPTNQLIDLNTQQGLNRWKNFLKRKKYGRSTKPRDNSEDTLIDVCINHLDLVIKCFPCLFKQQSMADEIVEKFINLVAKNGEITDTIDGSPVQKKVGWGMEDPEYQRVLDKLKAKLNILSILEITSEHPSEKSSLSSSRRSSEGSNNSTIIMAGAGFMNTSLNSSLGSDFEFFPSDTEQDSGSSQHASPCKTRAATQAVSNRHEEEPKKSKLGR
jgi:hypothetical protein